MIEHIWSVLCTKSLVDSDTNNISLFEIVDELTVENFTNPGVIKVDYEIVTLWYREKAEKKESVEYKINLVTPSGKDKGGPEVECIFKPGILRNRSKVIFKAFPLDEIGSYKFQILEKKGGGKFKEVGFIPISVKEKSS
jgi:hypothetical protein